MDSSNNDAFGSFGVSGPVISSGGEPGAALPVSVGQTDEKKRKWVVVLAALLFLCAAVGLMVFALLRSGNNNDSVVKKTFNTYVNYLLEGKESDDNVSDYKGLSYVYYFDKEDMNAILNEAEASSVEEYYSGLSEKLGDFVNVVEAEKMDDEKKALTQEYYEVAKAYFDMRSKYFLNSEDVKRYYVKNGYGATKKFIENYYAVAEGEREEIVNLKSYLTSAAEYYLNEFNAYSALGCVDDIEIKYDCAGGKVTFDYDASIIELEAAALTVVDTARKSVLEGYREIYDKVAQ